MARTPGGIRNAARSAAGTVSGHHDLRRVAGRLTIRRPQAGFEQSRRGHPPATLPAGGTAPAPATTGPPAVASSARQRSPAAARRADAAPCADLPGRCDPSRPRASVRPRRRQPDHERRHAEPPHSSGDRQAAEDEDARSAADSARSKSSQPMGRWRSRRRLAPAPRQRPGDTGPSNNSTPGEATSAASSRSATRVRAHRQARPRDPPRWPTTPGATRRQRERGT
jgi:hypothetical protein